LSVRGSTLISSGLVGNIGHGWKRMVVANILAYCDIVKINKFGWKGVHHTTDQDISLGPSFIFGGITFSDEILKV
jgi:hypothetical protein